MKKTAAVLLLLLLTACGSSTDTATTLVPAAYGDLPGWGDDHQAEAYKLFAASCRSANYKTRTGERIGDAGDWRNACGAAAANADPTDDDARRFFEAYFKPYRVTTASDPLGHLTGYYEPVLHGSMKPHGPYQVPVYGVPGDLPKDGTPYLTRAEIERGALKGRATVLLYVDDPVMLFFLHVQGSGKVLLDDGRTASLQYAGRNNQTYVAISGILKQNGDLQQVSMESIRNWLYAHPERIRGTLDQNPCFIFFKLAEGDASAKGALGLPLVAGRSVAVDDDRAAYGVPIYVATTHPDFYTRTDAPFERLMVAGDTGSALSGPHRIDIFFGRGEQAEWEAGHQNTRGAVYWLLPERQ